MKNIFRNLPLLLAVAALAAGCEKEHPAPPTASTELLVRFFGSMRKGDHKSAVQQGIKLYALDNSQENIIQLVMLEQANEYVVQAQRALNTGNLKAALDVLKAGMKAYPDNRTLPQAYRRVLQLRNVRALLDAMDSADNTSAMSAALTAARIGLAANTTPELEKHFAAYEKKIKELSKKEKAVEKTPSIVEPVIEPKAVPKA